MNRYEPKIVWNTSGMTGYSSEQCSAPAALVQRCVNIYLVPCKTHPSNFPRSENPPRPLYPLQRLAAQRFGPGPKRIVEKSFHSTTGAF